MSAGARLVAAQRAPPRRGSRTNFLDDKVDVASLSVDARQVHLAQCDVARGSDPEHGIGHLRGDEVSHPNPPRRHERERDATDEQEAERATEQEFAHR